MKRNKTLCLPGVVAFAVTETVKRSNVGKVSRVGIKWEAKNRCGGVK